MSFQQPRDLTEQVRQIIRHYLAEPTNLPLKFTSTFLRQGQQIHPDAIIGKGIVSRDDPVVDEVLTYDGERAVWGPAGPTNLNAGAAAADEVLTATGPTGMDWKKLGPENLNGGVAAADEVLTASGASTTDWKKLIPANLAAGVAAAGEVLTALSATTMDWVTAAAPTGLFSTNFRQNAWTTYTPALTAVTTNPNLGSGGNFAQNGRWTRQADRTIHLAVYLRFGTTGVAAGSGHYIISLPVASQVGMAWNGSGYLYDNSADAFVLVTTFLNTSTTVKLVVEGASIVTNASPWVWAASDIIGFSLTYEAAS